MDPDAYPGGPKTYGSYESGFATLTGTINQSIKPAHPLWQPGNVGGGPGLHPSAGQVSDQRRSPLPLTRLHVPVQVSACAFVLVFVFSLKVPSGQIRPAWEWYHWIGLQKDINRLILTSDYQTACIYSGPGLLFNQFCGSDIEIFHPEFQFSRVKKASHPGSGFATKNLSIFYPKNCH